MGSSLSWIAVNGKPPTAVRELLSLTPTGLFGETPESEACASSLPSGWFLIVFNGFNHPAVLQEHSLRRLSAGCELVAAFVEEHVMASMAAGWKDGREVWSLYHQSEKGITHLEEEGSFPEAYPEIKARAFQEQKSKGADGKVDYVFDIPLTLAKSITGFKHDEDGPDKFEILKKVAPSERGGFWSRLFGRR